MPAKYAPFKVAVLSEAEREKIAGLAATAGLSISNWFRRAAGLPQAEMGGYRERANRKKAPKRKAKKND